MLNIREVRSDEHFAQLRANEDPNNDYLYICKHTNDIKLSDNGTLKVIGTQNQNAFSAIVVDDAVVEAAAEADALALKAGANVKLVPNNENNEIEIDAEDTTYGVATTTDLGLVKSGGDITVNPDGTVTVNVSGGGSGGSTVTTSTTNGNILVDGKEVKVYSHPSSNVAAGTYKSVTVDSDGHVTSGTNPTTLEGYGITDAETKGAASSAVSTHDTSTSAHNDIRELISALTTRLNTLADSDDTTLDQMSEIAAYIKANKTLIESITTTKVNVSDIINNLTTNVSNKPLSAAQGVALKGLIDALQTEVNNKADSSDLSSHRSDTGIHVSPTDRINWNDTNDKKHTHDNKLILDDTTASFRTEDKSKLDGIATGANKYTHPSYTAKSSGLYKVTVDDTGHVSATTAVAKSDITGLGIPAQDTTYSNFVKSGSGAKAGLVPAPSTTAGTTKYLREDGTWQVPSNTAYTNASLGQGYGTCTTAADTVAKVVTLSNYALTAGGIVSVKFTYAVPASATMNINSKGAKNIFYRGSAIVAGIINAGDIATFIYDGTQYHLISIDKGILNNTEKGALGFVTSTAENLIPTISTIAYWDGAYSGTKSNLAYCAKGAFGSIVTKNTGDYLPISGGTLSGSLTAKTVVISNTETALTDGKAQNMLGVQYKDAGEQTFTTYPIRVIGSTQTSPYNAGVLLGSNNGTTIVGSGESSGSMPAVIKAYNNEHLYLTSDGQIRMYTGCANDASTYTEAVVIGNDGSTTLKGNIEINKSDKEDWTSLEFVNSKNTGSVIGINTKGEFGCYLRPTSAWVKFPTTAGTLALNTVATTSANGLMSSSDKSKLDGISAMTAATADAAGKAGLVPAPAAGKQSSFLRGDGTWATPTNTKNTAGSTDSSKKLFLIGAESQAANPTTYSHDTAYVGTDGCLYSNKTKVSVEGHTHDYLSTSGGTVSGTVTISSGSLRAKDNLQLYYPDLDSPTYGSAVWTNSSATSFSASWTDYSLLTFGGANDTVRNRYITMLRGKLTYAHASSILYANKSWTTVSDARVKTDEGYLDSSNEKTAKYISLWEKMPPRAYKLLDEIDTEGENAKMHLGYYAQEVEKALKESGLTEEDFHGLSKMDDIVLDSGTEEDIEYFDVKYGLSYTDCHMLTDIKLRQVVNETLPAMQTAINSLTAQIETLTNIVAELKGE